ncbi:MAG: helix-turn-helix transcriptional regulator [Clostridia bacterium]|nr:helix-turn-helix transcriptional regulator [Clostridia bacterium]
MNKETVGKFLKKLRNEKRLTQSQLSQKLVGHGNFDRVISKWEKGQSLPNIVDLKTLAKLFNVSVDEILNGARYEEIDFEKKYHSRDGALIESCFKELLSKMVDGGLSWAENKEFDFIVNHFYHICLPAIECKDEDAYRNSTIGECALLEDIDYIAHDVLPGGLSDIKFEIYKQTAFMYKSDIKEKIWSASKKFVFSEPLSVVSIMNNMEDSEANIKNRLNVLDDFEKDFVLSTAQRIDHKRSNESYNNVEKLAKRAIKLLIECGAKLNKSLLSYYRIVGIKCSIIDNLENLHERYKAPLLAPVCENGMYQYYLVDNTAHNRAQLGIKYEDTFFAENDYPELEKRLKAGERTILRPVPKFIGGYGGCHDLSYAHKQVLNMSLEAYQESREDERTKELLNNLDDLSLEAIMEKYFQTELKDEDMNTMSIDDLAKRYYSKETVNE